MTEPAKLHTVPQVAESLVDRSRRLNAEATEAARGALGHWIELGEGKISNYQCVVPTTWNCSPRDDRGNPGAKCTYHRAFHRGVAGFKLYFLRVFAP